MQYILGIDSWEGNPHLDEAVLKAAGVEFMIVRLNSITGGHHMDENFEEQWAQAEPFVRWPYFVYNPWVTGAQNFAWLAQHIPPECKAVSYDVEVRKEGYSPAEYGKQLAAFRALAAPVWKLNLYTGKWFEPLVTPWPTDIEYWYARYPYVVYPPVVETWTWDQLKCVMDSMVWAPGASPGPCHLWQITGDRIILPGCGGSIVDINAWKGTMEELRAYTGSVLPPPLDWAHSIDAWARGNGYSGPYPE